MNIQCFTRLDNLGAGESFAIPTEDVELNVEIVVEIVVDAEESVRCFFEGLAESAAVSSINAA